MKSLITVLTITCFLLSCKKDETIDPSTIRYHLISKPTPNFNELIFDFDKIFVQQLIVDINPGHILENNQTISLNLRNSDTVFLGSGQGGVFCRACTTDSVKFEFRLITSNYKVRTDTSELSLKKVYNVNLQNVGSYDHNYDTTSVYLFLSEGQSKDIFIELDVDKSILLDSNNLDWINPVLTVSKK